MHAIARNEPPGNSGASVQEELRCTQLLCDVGAKLAHEQEQATLYRDILDTAIALTHADAGTVQILNPERDALEILARKGFSAYVTEHFRWVSARSAPSCGAALRACCPRAPLAPPAEGFLTADILRPQPPAIAERVVARVGCRA